MKSGYTKKEIENVRTALASMGIKAKYDGVTKSGHLKMKSKNNVHTFLKSGDDIVSLTIKDFPSVKRFDEASFIKLVRKTLKSRKYSTTVKPLTDDMVVVEVNSFGLLFTYSKELSEHEKGNVPEQEIADKIKANIEDEILKRFRSEKEACINDEVRSVLSGYMDGEFVKRLEKCEVVIGKDPLDLFCFSGKLPELTEDGFIVKGNRFSVLYKNVEHAPEIIDKGGLSKAYEALLEIESGAWKKRFADNVIAYISKKPCLSAFYQARFALTAADSVKICTKYDNGIYRFSDSFEIPFDKEQNARDVSDRICETFIERCKANIENDIEKKREDLERSGLCYRILPAAIFKVVEMNEGAANRNMIYQALAYQKANTKTMMFVDGYTGTLPNISLNAVIRCIVYMEKAGILISEECIFNNESKDFRYRTVKSFRDILVYPDAKGRRDYVGKEPAEWTEIDWTDYVRHSHENGIDKVEGWLVFSQVFDHKMVCDYMSEEIKEILNSAPDSVKAYLNAADIGPGYDIVLRNQ